MSQLKIIAMIFMFIDHFAYVMIERGVGITNGSGMTNQWYMIDRVMRGMGRIAFPIFCFTIVEGFQKTKDAKAYLRRLFLFAVVSEIPFDLAFRGSIIQMNYQNVFWTLAFGLASLMIYEDQWMSKWKRILGLLLCFYLPNYFHTDYSVYGVLTIFLMYLFRKEPIKACMAGYIVLLLLSTTEVWAALGFLLILFYNGQRGNGSKMFCYLFYPVHLLLLVAAKPYIISILSGFISRTIMI